MIIAKFSSFFTDTLKCVKCPTSRIDCETIFLSILKNFFSSDRIFGGKSISAIYNDSGGGTKKLAAAQKKTVAHRKIVERAYHFP